MIHYTYNDEIFYCEGTKITKEDAKAILGAMRLRKLIRTGKCNIHGEKPAINITQGKLLPLKTLKKNLRILEENRKHYKAEQTKYSGQIRYELWRRNLKYGYYNFATYLNDLEQETIDKAILNDIDMQRELKKKK